jgi:hypothetical protein
MPWDVRDGASGASREAINLSRARPRLPVLFRFAKFCGGTSCESGSVCTFCVHLGRVFVYTGLLLTTFAQHPCHDSNEREREGDTDCATHD